ncbi:MAG: hypothetical protein ACKOVB_16065 [Terrabacter sp.]
MDALDVLKVCLRRWWVFVPVVALALGAGLGIVRGQQPTYQAYASFALVYEQPPDRDPQAPDPRVNNPLAEEGGALLGEAILAELGTSARQRELGDADARGAEPGADAHGTRYSVSLPSNSSTYYISSWAADDQSAEQTIEAVLGALPALSKSIQDRAGAPLESQYFPFTTTSPQVAELPPGSSVKILVGVLGIGLLAGAALAVLTDFVLERVAARRRPAPRPEKSPSKEKSPRGGRDKPAKGRPGKSQRVVPMAAPRPVPRGQGKKGSPADQHRTASG